MRTSNTRRPRRNSSRHRAVTGARQGHWRRCEELRRVGGEFRVSLYPLARKSLTKCAAAQAPEQGGESYNPASSKESKQPRAAQERCCWQ